MGYVIPGS